VRDMRVSFSLADGDSACVSSFGKSCILFSNGVACIFEVCSDIPVPFIEAGMESEVEIHGVDFDLGRGVRDSLCRCF
jgi:hypothetical protein